VNKDGENIYLVQDTRFSFVKNTRFTTVMQRSVNTVLNISKYTFNISLIISFLAPS